MREKLTAAQYREALKRAGPVEQAVLLLRAAADLNISRKELAALEEIAALSGKENKHEV